MPCKFLPLRSRIFAMHSMVFDLRNEASDMRGEYFRFGLRRHIYKACKKALGI